MSDKPIDTRHSYDQNFKKAIDALNDKQRNAVDVIDGPVLVVAGPGTGKTQLLAARVGNILKNTDALPRNILCLTFTEAGTISMRNRLLQFIGPEAYNVNISTFHAFCNQVIKENLAYFGGFRDLQLVSDLELVDVLHEIIDEFPDDHPLKKLKGEIYYNRRRIQNLFGTMKQESWGTEEIIQAIEELPEYLIEQDGFRYKRKYTDKKSGKVYEKGDVNKGKIAKELKKYEGLKSVAPDIKKYNAKLAEIDRFDYNDMIHWVIKSFEEHPDLLADYQERYQYILVDEYQDTNGSQNKLLFQLSDFWEDPNLFVVGDDDQSIFRFQGANMDNIVDFKEKFDPTVIVLDRNYRSSQEILDRSKQLIDQNEERLVKRYSNLTKHLIESRKDGVKVDPKFISYYNTVHEQYGVAQEIIKLQKDGVALKEIAVIYKKHKNAAEIVKYLSLKNIPLNIKKQINVFDLPEARRLLNILHYLNEEHRRLYAGQALIFEILHYEYFKLNPRDIGKVAIYCSRKTDEQNDDRKWREVLANESTLKEIGVSDPGLFLQIGAMLESWHQQLSNVTIQVLFEMILTEGGVIETIMNSSEKAWRLQIVNTLFDLIKNETARKPSMHLKEFILMVEKMEDTSIELPLQKIVYAEDGVNFVTAHGSKGLEFEHVFIICGDAKNWEEKNFGRGSFSFPGTMVPATEQSDIEDDRRLFYVAMTRAKSHLKISFAKANENEKPQEATRFIHEAIKDDSEMKSIHFDEAEILEYKSELMRYRQGEVNLIDHDLIDQVLEKYKMSVTHLNKYLDCPLKFYFENILRVPMARSQYMGFGNAVHIALEMFFTRLEENPDRKIPEVSELVELFRKGMISYRSHFTDQQFEDLNKHGESIMIGYYDQYSHTWSTAKQFVPEHSISLTEYEGIPITGKLDLVMVYDQHVDVMDYKTGNFKNASKKLKGPNGPDEMGGDYWRQLVFYKILLNAETNKNWNMVNGIMDFVEPLEDKYKRHTTGIEDFEVDIVREQMKDSYTKIKNHEFEKGCEKEDCKWCSFVKDNFSLQEGLISSDDEEMPFDNLA